MATHEQRAKALEDRLRELGGETELERGERELEELMAELDGKEEKEKKKEKGEERTG